MKKRLLNAMAIVMALGMVFMAGNVWAEATGDTSGSLALTFTLDNPPSVTISAISSGSVDGVETDMDDGSNFTQSEVVHAKWEVNCNNAFAINFSGNSYEDTGGSQYGYPIFTKQDVDANGALVSASYDNLVTKYAILIDDEYSTALSNVDAWGGTSASDGITGEPANLILALTNGDTAGDGPDGIIGRIMASDDAGKAIVNLWAKGSATQDVQSGDYTSTVTLTVTLEEQGGDL